MKDIQAVVNIILKESSGCHDIEVYLPGLLSWEGARISCFKYLNGHIHINMDYPAQTCVSATYQW